MRMLEKKGAGEKIKVYSVIAIVYSLFFSAGLYIGVLSGGYVLDFRHENTIKLYVIFLGISIVLNIAFMVFFSEKNIREKYGEGKKTKSAENFIIVYRLFAVVYAIFAFRLMVFCFGENAFGYIISAALAVSLAVFPQKSYKTYRQIFPEE